MPRLARTAAIAATAISLAYLVTDAAQAQSRRAAPQAAPECRNAKTASDLERCCRVITPQNVDICATRPAAVGASPPNIQTQTLTVPPPLGGFAPPSAVPPSVTPPAAAAALAPAGTVPAGGAAPAAGLAPVATSTPIAVLGAGLNPAGHPTPGQGVGIVAPNPGLSVGPGGGLSGNTGLGSFVIPGQAGK